MPQINKSIVMSKIFKEIQFNIQIKPHAKLILKEPILFITIEFYYMFNKI